MMHEPSNSSCHDDANTEVSITRELIQIRGEYRYRDSLALARALADFRSHLAGDPGEPIRLRCRVTSATTLTVDITVAMFSDHSFAPVWCQLLARSAVAAGYDVRLRPAGGAA